MQLHLRKTTFSQQFILCFLFVCGSFLSLFWQWTLGWMRIAFYWSFCSNRWTGETIFVVPFQCFRMCFSKRFEYIWDWIAWNTHLDNWRTNNSNSNSIVCYRFCVNRWIRRFFILHGMWIPYWNTWLHCMIMAKWYLGNMTKCKLAAFFAHRISIWKLKWLAN